MKRAISLLVSSLLLASLLAACGNNSRASSTGSEASAPGGEQVGAGEVDFTQHETFTYWLYATPNDYYGSYSDNPVVQYINEMFNITLSVEQPVSGTEADSLSLMFGTGEYTDMIEMSRYTGSLSELYEDGVIIDIGEYLDYMPNFKAAMDASDGFRRRSYDDEGRILTLRDFFDDPEPAWGGLVYRRDILDTMTGGNIQFPSGNEHPTTVEDWDYMLPLMDQYFQVAGMQDYAALMIPYNAIFGYSELSGGFGAPATYFVENDIVGHGYATDGMYNYLAKLNEWFDAGYVYQDFVSSVNDMFFLPNTNMTYGGAAGVFYGLDVNIGDTMSMPEYGLFFDVYGLGNPLDEANGITAADTTRRTVPMEEGQGSAGIAISSSCQNIPKLLSVLDYMYSHDGAMLRTHGLTKEQIPEGDTVYASAGLEDGMYWFDENGEFRYDINTSDMGGEADRQSLNGVRLPGYYTNSYNNNMETNDDMVLIRAAQATWAQYDDVAGKVSLPSALSYSIADEKTLADNNVNINDYANSMIPQFIMGTQPLNEESWQAFLNQLEAYGLGENLRIQQEAYDRYLAR